MKKLRVVLPSNKEWPVTPLVLFQICSSPCHLHAINIKLHFSHHHCLILDIFIVPERKILLISRHSSCLLPSLPLAVINLFFCIWIFIFWTPQANGIMTYVVFCVTQDSVFRIHAHCNVYGEFYGMWILSQ